YVIFVYKVKHLLSELCCFPTRRSSDLHASLLRLTPLPNSTDSDEAQQAVRQITTANYIEGNVNGGNIAGRDIIIHQTTTQLDTRSEEHTSELQSREKLVCRLLLEKKKA